MAGLQTVGDPAISRARPDGDGGSVTEGEATNWSSIDHCGERGAKALGSAVVVRGVVTQGDRRGRALGFPTANVDVVDPAAVPADGVYAGWVCDLRSGGTWAAAISVGTNPTFHGVCPRVESHVLGRSDLDLYGAVVEVTISHYVRPMVAFSSVPALVTQMRADVARVRCLLGLPPAGAARIVGDSRHACGN